MLGALAISQLLLPVAQALHKNTYITDSKFTYFMTNNLKQSVQFYKAGRYVIDFTNLKSTNCITSIYLTRNLDQFYLIYLCWFLVSLPLCDFAVSLQMKYFDYSSAITVWLFGQNSLMVFGALAIS